ncbi:MAG: TetR family transcriptional regulator [Nakamurella sp.]
MDGAVRTRDPARRERILLAAAHLVAANGYAGTNLADIGAAAGIGGTGIYRHFRNKAALAAALLDRLLDQLVSDATAITADITDPEQALHALVLDHLDAARSDRELFLIYLRESAILPADDLRRIRGKMRRYVDEWVSVLAKLRPGASDGELRTTIQAAIGALQSMLSYDARLPRGRLTEILVAAAHAVLLSTAAPEVDHLTGPSNASMTS